MSRKSLKWAAWMVAVLPLVATTSPGLEVARMKLPPELAAAAERLPAEGYGGANRGRYAIGDYRGDFTRIESRFAVFDPVYAANRGKSSFTLEGPEIAGTIAAECHFKERVVTVGILTFDAKKLAYVCEINDGRGSVGHVTLGEPKPDGFKQRVLARAERRGVAEIGAVEVGIRSVHEFERSRLTSRTPLGYVLSFGPQVVGAIEITDSNPTLYLDPRIAFDLRRAALVTALSLSVLRDPANSALGD